jgi:hypothetical protein
MEQVYEDALWKTLEKLKSEGKVRYYGIALGPAIGWLYEAVNCIRERDLTSVQHIYNMIEQHPGRAFHDAAMEVGGVYEVTAAVEYDFDLAKLNGTAVGVLDEYDTPYIEVETVGTFPGAVLATGDHFNDSENDYSLIRDELKASLRDMEGAAIAHVCKKNAVRCRMVKCITNVAGKGAMTGQYEANRELALKRLAEVMKEYI